MAAQEAPAPASVPMVFQVASLRVQVWYGAFDVDCSFFSIGRPLVGLPVYYLQPFPGSGGGV